VYAYDQLFGIQNKKLTRSLQDQNYQPALEDKDGIRTLDGTIHVHPLDLELASEIPFDHN
jgi:hypothetical protein